MALRAAICGLTYPSVGVYVAVGWTASKLTEFRITNGNLTQQLKSVETTAEEKAQAVEKYRVESEQAKQAAAKMEGELSITRATLAARRPTTQPSLLEKLARLAGE